VRDATGVAPARQDRRNSWGPRCSPFSLRPLLRARDLGRSRADRLRRPAGRERDAPRSPTVHADLEIAPPRGSAPWSGVSGATGAGGSRDRHELRPSTARAGLHVAFDVPVRG
jgi:hypothetical protein